MRLVGHLDESERLGEVLFGLIMVLTFTLGAGLTVHEGREGVRELLVATLGCNIAWGVIDGVLYAMNQVLERGRRARLVERVQKASDRAAALEIVRRELEPTLAEVASAQGRAHLYDDVLQGISGLAVGRTRFQKQDLYGALACFWLVFVSTLPAVLPFVFLSDPRLALRVSNALLLGMLFLVGQRWAQYSHGSRLGTGFAMLSIGLVLVGVAIALGG